MKSQKMLRARCLLWVLASCIHISTAQDAATLAGVPDTTDLSLQAQQGEHVYIIPDSPECEAEAASTCHSMLKTCSGSNGCELQCISSSPPTFSDDCIKSHPCVVDVDQWCVDVKSGEVMECLHRHRNQLSARCVSSEPCLRLSNWDDNCGAAHSHHHKHGKDGQLFGIKRFMHGLFPFAHANWQSGPCACMDECGEHLNDAICSPCDTTDIGNKQHRVSPCVQNSLCGLGKRWCRVSTECKAPFVHVLDITGCHGPYPAHPSCEAYITHRITNEPITPLSRDVLATVAERVKLLESRQDVNEALEEQFVVNASVPERHQVAALHIQREMHRCVMQRQGYTDGVCPEPLPDEVSAASAFLDQSSLTRVRSCFAPPSVGSFIRHFFDKLPAVTEHVQHSVLRAFAIPKDNHSPHADGIARISHDAGSLSARAAAVSERVGKPVRFAREVSHITSKDSAVSAPHHTKGTYWVVLPLMLLVSVCAWLQVRYRIISCRRSEAGSRGHFSRFPISLTLSNWRTPERPIEDPEVPPGERAIDRIPGIRSRK